MIYRGPRLNEICSSVTPRSEIYGGRALMLTDNLPSQRPKGDICDQVHSRKTGGGESEALPAPRLLEVSRNDVAHGGTSGPQALIGMATIREGSQGPSDAGVQKQQQLVSIDRMVSNYFTVTEEYLNTSDRDVWRLSGYRDAHFSAVSEVVLE
ncbi:hypothetical protein SKAU_G00024290 [Synaphobranchus kaupii]|uniref:Uncharacterized protein n=1 Tax=Synaphobranchus kaupii TaxID=118154 RepID=A0A9Q1GDP6_SYNKA|nr:hypothetical protein SKAU_G00024290 [Synaphobranchus kaupii]